MARVSADGNLVIGTDDSQEEGRAFRWSPSVGLFQLPPPPGRTEVAGEAISGDGRVIGGYSHVDYRQEVAVIWTAAGGTRNLWDILVSQGVNPANDGWSELMVVTDLSQDGRFAAGTGMRNGKREGFVADIAPQVQYARVAGGIQLSWPPGYRLQRTSALEGGSWTVVPEGSAYTATFNSGMEFYRLVEGP